MQQRFTFQDRHLPVHEKVAHQEDGYVIGGHYQFNWNVTLVIMYQLRIVHIIFHTG